jgi:LCP family protein required for cell wall assembly
MSYYNEHNPPVEDTRPITTRDLVAETQPASLPKLRRQASGCSKPLIVLAVVLAAYFFAPFNPTILVLGIDRALEGTAVGRSDTIILAEVQPLSGSVEMLSIPRDLWVPIPGYGESRINAAHAFGEAAQTGSGPQLALQTVRENFGVNVGHYLRIRLEGFASVIDSLGGIQIVLPTATGAYPAGEYAMDGEQALAFVRDRTGDDFFRMQHGQIFIVAMGKKMLNPLSWVRFPGALIALVQTMDTNVPVWDFPRIGFAILRAVIFSGFDARSIPREATTSWVTENGAQVLLPNWDLIRPLMREMFGLF